MSFTVCGLEKVIVGTYNGLNEILIQDTVTKTNEFGELTESSFSSVFTTDTSLSSPLCSIKNFVLCEDALCLRLFTSQIVYIE